MKRLLLISAASAMLLTMALPARANAVYNGSSGSLSASATFSVVDGKLQVVLTNTSLNDVVNPTQVLTGLFFDTGDNPSLTPISAQIGAGSTVLFADSISTNVGGEWAYKTGEGISSAGLGVFGEANFNGPNLQGPDAVAGLQYGITSAGDNPETGNAPVNGNYQLIQNSVTFLLDIPDGADFDLSKINNVVFQYGTALSDPQIAGSCEGGNCNSTSTVPEPTSLLLLGSGIAVLGVAALRRKNNH